jgi:hypothetical protein
MPEVQEVFRMATQKVRPDPGFEDRQYDYRRKKERNRKIGVFAFVAGMGAVAAVLVLRSVADRQTQPAAPRPTNIGTVSPSTTVGFIGVPPEGATPSTPERGELVLSYWSSPTRMWLYADGRLIWVRHGDFPYGANTRSTGYLEQRLTPEGAELMRSEVLSTGLFEQDLEHRIRVAEDDVRGSIGVRNGKRLVRIEYSPGGFTELSPEQDAALVTLHGRLADPASWLPASAWDDSEVRAYVPSAFALCFDWGRDRIGTDQLLDLLPGPAADLLRTKHLTSEFAVHCYEVATEEARALADIFDEAGYRDADPNSAPYVLAYSVSAPDPINDEIPFSFEPVLPHGDWTCSPCG